MLDFGVIEKVSAGWPQDALPPRDPLLEPSDAIMQRFDIGMQYREGWLVPGGSEEESRFLMDFDKEVLRKMVNDHLSRSRGLLKISADRFDRCIYKCEMAKDRYWQVKLKK